MSKKTIITIVAIVICITIFIMIPILLLVNKWNRDFNYNTAKEVAIKYLNDNEQQLQQWVDQLYENKDYMRKPNNKIRYATYSYSKDFNFENEEEYIQLDLDAQGMLGGQYYGLIYSKANSDELIIYDEYKKTGKGNNIFIRQKIKKYWYFYYNDFDGKVDTNKIN